MYVACYQLLEGNAYIMLINAFYKFTNKSSTSQLRHHFTLMISHICEMLFNN